LLLILELGRHLQHKPLAKDSEKPFVGSTLLAAQKGVEEKRTCVGVWVLAQGLEE